MENIEIRILGNGGDKSLTPASYDIRNIIDILQNMEDLLASIDEKERPLVSYEIQSGSVRHVFTTTKCYVVGFSVLLTQILNTNSLENIDIKAAKAFERLQYASKKNEFTYQISTSVRKDLQLFIKPDTNFIRTSSLWVDTEVYLYGTLTNAGGKSRANIHLDTKEYGLVTIDTGKSFLEGQEQNLLYKKFGVHALGKQNIDTGQIDTKNLKLINLIAYNPTFEKGYVDALIEKGSATWNGTDSDVWLQEMRGVIE